ncbi:uncharacterized protein LOC122531935 isoform X1 [Frieseomelitta varia]|uniref:uncharacterized protein LOC122531935 isoform X1 n=1 Tax=Frieseomelitta varia TaxID=561572 RepID=UPI001CB67B76|nr:uncharacterized protein LOC122531935 isoform X1 [Frieseomelitta varia]
MHKHTSQLRGPSGPGSGHHVANRGPVRRWNSFHGGGSIGGGASNFNDTVGNGNLPPGVISKASQEPFRAVPKAVQALRSESVDRSHRVQPPPPPAFPRRRFSVCFGKRTGGSARRPNECFVLEPSEMIVDAGVNCVTGRAWFILRYYQASTTIDAFFQEAYRH